MSRLMLCGFVFFAFASLVMAEADTDLKPIGFVFESIDDLDEDAPANFLTVLRDGKEVQAVMGDEIYAGDVITTGATPGMSIAFVDQSAIRLHTQSEMRLSAEPSTVGLGGMTLVSGSASVAFQRADATPRSFNVGVGLRAAAVTTGTPAKLTVYVLKDATGNGFTATVGVLKGIATLTPKGSSGTDLTAGGAAIMTIKTPVKGVTGNTPVEIKQVSLTKDEIATLHGLAVSETAVTTGKGGSAKLKATMKISDGTIVSVQITEINGVATAQKSTTKETATKKTISSWSENTTKISFKKTYEGYQITSSNGKTGAPGKASIKGPDKSSFKGTSIIDVKTGIITFTTVTPNKKDGTSVIYTYNPAGANGVEQTIIRFKAGTVALATTITFDKVTGKKVTSKQEGTVDANGKFTATTNNPTTTETFAGNPPSNTLPDGHAIDQNNPPKVTSP